MLKISRGVSFLKRIYLVLLIIILCLGSIGLWLVIKASQKPSHEDTAILSVDKPSEKPIKPDDYKSTAVGDEPKHITLPSINAKGFIEKVGVDQHKQVGAPKNIHLAGWFIGGAKPGQKGLSIIDGHVDGVSSKGIFWSLKQLKKGDTFEIDRADGKKLSFEVFDKRAVTVKETIQYLFSQDPGVASQLNLITCSGAFDTQTREYQERIIISSKLIS